MNEPLTFTQVAQNISYTNDRTNNRLLSAGSTTYTYDNNGNRETATTGGVTTTYSWDYENRLTGVAIPGGTSVQHVYDGMGNRIARIVDGNETRYVLDLNGDMSRVLAETDATGDVTAYYVYGHGLVSRIEPSGDRNFYHFNNRGDTVALSDDSGTITDRYAFDEYGKLMASTGTTENPFKFVGRFGVMDEGDDGYFMRARFYDAGVGRFLSEDPLGFGGGSNFYMYSDSNPVIGIDPSGLDTYFLRRSGTDPSGSLITHNFFYTTNSDGTLKNTYGWGTLQDESGNGLWERNNLKDREAANKDILARTLYERANFINKIFIKEFIKGKHVGDSTFDEKIEKAFLNFSVVEEWGYRTKYDAFNLGGVNCKVMAWILYRAAAGASLPYSYILW